MSNNPTIRALIERAEKAEARVEELEACILDVKSMLTNSQCPKLYSIERIEELEK